MKAFVRRPLGNFFIKKELQIRLMTKIVLTVLITTVVCIASLLFVFWFRFKTILLYQMNIEGELSKERIVDVLLPSLIISGVVNILLGIVVGLYASRKYAVPIYKLEQWAMLLKNGHLTAKLRFREKEEMKELSDHCNLLSEEIRNRFTKLLEHIKKLKEDGVDEQQLTEMEEVISDLELQSGMDVTTGFYALEEKESGGEEKPST
jgi:polyhydroxyalkanoate synthesis regulator phasin